MLQTYSWSQYIILIALLAATYYLIAAAILYRQEWSAFLRNIFDKAHPQDVSPPKSESIMGKTAPSINMPKSGVEQTTADQLWFHPEDDNFAHQPAPADFLLTGTVADLLQEIHRLCDDFEKGMPATGECLDKLRIVLKAYPDLATHTLKNAINLHIKSMFSERLNLDLANESINECWPVNA